MTSLGPSVTLCKRNEGQLSSRECRFETYLVGAQVHTNVKNGKREGLSKGLSASRLRVQSSFSKTVECCVRSLACLFLTDARRSSANKMYDRQKKTRGTLQAASSAALRSPADAFPVNRSATGGLPVKHRVCKGGSCIRRQKATRQRDHTSPVLPVTVTGAGAAGGCAAIGVLPADPFSSFTGTRPGGEPSP